MNPQKEIPPDHPKQKQAGPRYYDYIAVVIFCAFLICGSMLLFLNTSNVGACVEEMFGQRKAFILQLYFWAALGATITCYTFFADDRERNAIEFLKERPDPNVLRWPDSQDVVLYVQRIIMSGVMGVLGAAILIAGLGIFDASQQKWEAKQKAFFIVFCVVVGMYQNDFLAFIAGFKEQFFKGGGKSVNTGKKDDDDAGQKLKNEGEDLGRIRQKLQDLTKIAKTREEALEWIAREYPIAKRDAAHRSLDYSKDLELFIANPPGKDAKDILSKLLKQLEHA